MVENDLTITSNSKTDLARFPPCFTNLLPHIYKVNNHGLAFYKRVGETIIIDAPNPYDKKPGWLKNQNKFFGTDLVSTTHSSNAFVDIVDSMYTKNPSRKYLCFR